MAMMMTDVKWKRLETPVLKVPDMKLWLPIAPHTTAAGGDMFQETTSLLLTFQGSLVL